MPGLWVITPGLDPTLAVYHLRHDTVRALISQLRRDVPYVVIEVQAAAADTFALAEFADAALITVEVGKTSRDDAADTVRRLRQLRTPVLGAAVIPALGGRISVRPPRQDQPRPGSGRSGESAANGAAIRGGHPEPLTSNGALMARSHDGQHDQPSRVPRK